MLSTPVVPAYHPANPYGEDVFFQGRPYGYAHPPEINYYEHETLRIAAGLEGDLTDSASWNVSVVYGANDALLNPRDVHAANFQAALNGFGGSGCASGADRAPGQGGCLFFNPFSSNFAADPGSPLANGRELYEFIIGDYIGLGDSQLTTVEANVSGDLPVFRGGYAVGQIATDDR